VTTPSDRKSRRRPDARTRRDRPSRRTPTSSPMSLRSLDRRSRRLRGGDARSRRNGKRSASAKAQTYRRQSRARRVRPLRQRAYDLLRRWPRTFAAGHKLTLASPAHRRDRRAPFPLKKRTRSVPSDRCRRRARMKAPSPVSDYQVTAPYRPGCPPHDYRGLQQSSVYFPHPAGSTCAARRALRCGLPPAVNVVRVRRVALGQRQTGVAIACRWRLSLATDVMGARRLATIRPGERGATQSPAIPSRAEL